jgi:hypothetical protein
MNRIAALALVSALPLLAAVEGRVLNQTTGRPQSGATVTLYKLGGGGPQALESKKSEAEGRFRFDQEVQPPFMVQAVVDGVIYTKMLPPGSPAGNLEIAAYSATTRNANELVQQHMILLEPSSS